MFVLVNTLNANSVWAAGPIWTAEGLFLIQFDYFDMEKGHPGGAQANDISLRSAFICCCYSHSAYVIIPPASTKLKGGYTGITLSVCPSVDRIVSLCIFNNTHWIHFIFAHLIKQLQKVCRV